MLRDLAFPTTIDTSTHDLIADFFVPALKASVRYDRGVGYFTSGWLRIAAEGMVKFAQNGGRARWVTSPILSEEDWEALQEGDAARDDPVLHSALSRSIDDLAQLLDEDTRSALAWMIADEILTFKLALPYNKLEGGDFHDKFGVFTDAEGNQVSFNGSYNESVKGTRNYESLKIFNSWNDQFESLVQSDVNRFERLWNNKDPNVRVFDLPDAAKELIVRFQSEERPYPKPPWVSSKSIRETRGLYQAARPSLPDGIQLREYQEEAVDAWLQNGGHGIFEMATGTGKTITALAGSVRLLSQQNRLVIVIACPYTHLVSQWATEVDRFGYRYLVVPGSHRDWQDALANELLDFTADYIDSLVILTTHTTFSNSAFWEILEQRTFPLLLIADEAHGLGAPQRQLGLRDSYRFRLGLTATPRRWLDEEGTDALFSYFSDTVFEFSLAEAIPDYLTPYEYYPFFVELSGEELEEYYEMTQKVTRRAMVNEDEDDEVLKLYLILRQKIVVNATAKYECLADIIDTLDDRSYTLVYCSPEQIDRVQAILNAKQVIQHRFTFEEDLGERERLLSSFARKQHQVLVAMRCLDEGVDVPETRNAVFVASSGNPRQFVQRRGRILRKAYGKKRASIYDIIVVPSLEGELDDATFKMERRILKREIRRYDEFASLALNSTHALNQIAPIRRRYLLLEEDT